MTETPTAQPARTPPARPAPARAAATWRASDLLSHATAWGVSAAAIRAAFRSSGKTSVASPQEAESMVREFMRQDLPTLERKGREARAQAKGGR